MNTRLKILGCLLVAIALAIGVNSRKSQSIICENVEALSQRGEIGIDFEYDINAYIKYPNSYCDENGWTGLSSVPVVDMILHMNTCAGDYYPGNPISTCVILLSAPEISEP